ncbi:hypothetical protein [Aquimarina sediminis]|uniref:hypothetical protein n=1 Tax=Aquimarina sediminis TaxID=2070536 RepID=UPI0019D46A51|nr:hypothetical protein [Aquimarina sediminis]
MLLKIGGIANIIIAVAHIIGLFWPEKMFEITGVGEKMKELSEIHNTLPYLVTIFIAIFFWIFGMYGLNSGNTSKKLPYPKLGVFIIAGIYLFRAIGEQSYNIYHQTTTSSETNQSIVALAIGLLFLFGGCKTWNKNKLDYTV